MTVRSEYGRALFLLAKEIGAIDEIKADLTACIQVFDMNPEYAKILDTPAISKEEKLSLADKAFSTLNEYVGNLVKMLSEKHSVSTLPDVYKTYLALYNEEMGIEEVEAVTAVPMTDSQLEAMRAKLEGITGKKIIIKNTVDKTILGGVKIRYEGRQVDGSLKTRLDGFSESLKNIVI